MYSSNKSIKIHEEEILKKMKVGSVMLEKEAIMSLLQCKTSSDCLLGKLEIPEDITAGGNSFISKGEMFVRFSYNFMAV